MAFRGWPAEAIEFFEGLEADNSKAYWQDHKVQYEAVVKAPMEALLAQLQREFGPAKIFRPYRDVRFSADKTPYKTNIAAVANRGGSIFYVSLSTEGLFAGSGYYHMARDQLVRYRQAVDDGKAGPALVKVVTQAGATGLEVGGDALKTAPRGYPADHPRIELLRHKGIYAGRGFEPGAWLGTAKAADRVVDVWRATKPLNAWLHKYVGQSTEPER
jgi:uncharacterized protein (TIGR02453 family)